MHMEETNIYLKDIFNFETLLSQHPGKRIKLRFNKNWSYNGHYFDFTQRYVEKSDSFFPNIFSIGNADKKKRNSQSDTQFHFIEVEPYKWLFIGAYLILETHSQIYDFTEFGLSVPYVKVERLTEYDKFIDKVVVDWVNKPQQFYYVNTDLINSVQIHEIHAEKYFERTNEFPGYDVISKRYFELKQVWHTNTWKDQLSSIYGVYLITDLHTGKLYVGSAYGDNGVYGRWSTYLSEGFDKDELEDSRYPNVELRNLVNKKGLDYIRDNFQYTLLEIFPKTELGKRLALERENYWKEVLQSRKYGYNKN